MKILWITNTLFPEVCKELNIHVPEVGGWMFSAAKVLLTIDPEIQLAVASLYSGTEFKKMFLNGVTYFLLPSKGGNRSYNREFEVYWNLVNSGFCPDLVHIHGTEYTHGLAYMKACGNKNVLVSIQGLVSVYERYYFGGISGMTFFLNTTFRDIARNDSIFKQHSNMFKRGFFEQQTIKATEHIIGRTSWDKSHSWAINSNVQYHFCNETLRDEFYNHQWSIDKCKKYSIFLSQANYPIKGFQQLVKALPIILKHYPDTIVYVAGENIFTNRGIKISSFGKYIRNLIKKNRLDKQFVFTGLLSEKEMCQQFLKSHVFVCPSSIENSPNSLGEAQLLGVPCIGSFVGGVSDMIKHDETGLLYRYEEIEMLAASICKIFSNDNLTIQLSERGRQIALNRHNKQENALNLISIYKEIKNLINS